MLHAEPGFKRLVKKIGRKEVSEDFWIDYAEFNRKDVEHIDDIDLIIGVNAYSYHPGPGSVYASDAYVLRKGTRALVIQSGGYDI